MRFLIIVGILPALLLIIFGQELFAFVFGEEWREAGFYASILAPMAFLRTGMRSPEWGFICQRKNCN